jgi:hypothetical protein
MARVLSIVTLAAVFGAASWAGYALTAPAGEEPAPPPAPSPAASPAHAPAGIGELDGGPAPKRKPAAAKEGPVRLTFNDLSQWDLDPKNVQYPASILALSGKDVDLVGYMIPYGDPESVTEFALVRDLGSCCFGMAPQPHHVVECKVEGGKPVAWVPGPVRVRGRFKVGERRQGQYLYSVYAIAVTDCVEVR